MRRRAGRTGAVMLMNSTPRLRRMTTFSSVPRRTGFTRRCWGSARRLALWGSLRYDPGVGVRGLCIRIFPWQVFMMPPLIDSLPSMAGSLNTIRGVFMLSWAWTGEPMASMALLNASIPANARASICVPVPGLASPIVKESGRIVWANGTFVAVPGIISGSADVAGYISFSVLSGNFSFAASDNHPAIVSKVHRLAVCSALWAKPQESSLNSTTNYGPLRLECPSTLFLSHVVRAGIIDGSRIPRVTTDALYAAVPTVPGVIRHRYLVTHALERLCISPQAEKRQHSCHVGADELAQAVYPVISENDVTMELCAVALCS